MSAPVIRFGPFEANLAARELRKAGVRLKLQDQPFRVLQTLLEKPGEVVTREELQERIWGEDTYVDFDKSLSAAIGKVREALGDSRTRPRYIETIPKVGYRFIGEIDAGPGRPVASIQDPRRSSPWQRWALAAGLAAAAVLASFYVPRSRPLEQSRPLRAVPLTAYEGAEEFPTFSPDGSQVAFAWNRYDGQGPALYVKSMGSEQPRPLTTGAGSATNPAWSPDGESIAFVTPGEEGARCELKLIPPTGGAIRTLTSLTCRAGAFDYSSLSWSPDSRVIAYPDRPDVDGAWGLSAVDVTTHETWRLTDPPLGIFGDDAPAFSRNGDRLAFLRRNSAFNASEIRTIELRPDMRPTAASSAVPLSGPYPFRGVNSVVWSKDDSTLLFLQGGAVWRAASGGGAATQTLAVGGWLRSASLDPSNGHLAFAQQRPDTDIWRLDRESGETRQLIASTHLDWFQSISPDGRRIAWTSFRSGFSEVWVSDADGSNRQQLTFLESQSGAPTWSPDGDWIVFDTRVNGNGDLYFVDSHGGPARPLLAGPEDDLQPFWSAGDSMLYFTSLRGGDMGTWRKAIDSLEADGPRVGSGKIEPIVRASGGSWARVSPDGRFLYHRGGFNDLEDRRRLYRKQLPDGDDVPIAESSRGFDAAGDAVYFATSEPPAIWRLEPESGKSQLLIRPEKETGQVAVSPDEHTILFTQAEPRQADLLLVEGIE